MHCSAISHLMIKTLKSTCFHFYHSLRMRNTILACNWRSNGQCNAFCFATHAASTLMSTFEHNKYATCRNCNLGITFHIILCVKFVTHANLVNVSFLCYKIPIGNILKPIGMLYNVMSV